MKYPVFLVECVNKISCEFNNHLTSRDKKKLAGYMQMLGFDDISAIFYDLKPETESKVSQSPVNGLSSVMILFVKIRNLLQGSVHF